MKTLSEAQLESLLIGAQTIEEDGYGVKVARLVGGDFLKLYRRKRLLSSALWPAPAQRFAENARRLNQLGIQAPSIAETMLVPCRMLNGVRYEPLPGETLRERWRILVENARNTEIERFGVFLGQLHQLGAYFRSLHLGNVLHLPSDSFGLIDLSDMKIIDRPLRSWRRKRNIQHMLRYAEDTAWLTNLHCTALLSGYSQSCGNQAAGKLAGELNRLHPRADVV